MLLHHKHEEGGRRVVISNSVLAQKWRVFGKGTKNQQELNHLNFIDMFCITHRPVVTYFKRGVLCLLQLTTEKTSTESLYTRYTPVIQGSVLHIIYFFMYLFIYFNDVHSVRFL